MVINIPIGVLAWPAWANQHPGCARNGSYGRDDSRLQPKMNIVQGPADLLWSRGPSGSNLTLKVRAVEGGPPAWIPPLTSWSGAETAPTEMHIRTWTHQKNLAQAGRFFFFRRGFPRTPHFPHLLQSSDKVGVKAAHTLSGIYTNICPWRRPTRTATQECGPGAAPKELWGRPGPA